MPPETKKQKKNPETAISSSGVSTGPIRWEHSFASDFGSNWHLAYTADDSSRVTQRTVWVKALIENKLNSDFTFQNFSNYLKSQFHVFSSILRSSVPHSIPLPPQYLKPIPVEPEETAVKQPDCEIQNEDGIPTQDEPYAFLVIGSLTIPIDHADRPFVVGRTNALNDLNENVVVPDLNLKNFSKLNSQLISRRHFTIAYGTMLPPGGNRSREKWYLTNYSKNGIIMNNDEIKKINEIVEIGNNSTITITNDIHLKFYSNTK
jgi:hypothetical protein